MMTEYLEVNRPNKRYCDGCPLTYVSHGQFDFEFIQCGALNKKLITLKSGKIRTPSNCPLKQKKNWYDGLEHIKCHDVEPNPHCFCPRCVAAKEDKE